MVGKRSRRHARARQAPLVRSRVASCPLPSPGHLPRPGTRLHEFDAISLYTVNTSRPANPFPMPQSPAPHSPRLAPALATVIILASILPGALRVGSGAPLLPEAVRLLGLASLLLWAASLLLMLRLRPLEEAAGGLDRLYYVHHVCGSMAYLCLLAHPVPLFLSASQRILPGISDWPLMAGWAALLLMMAMMLATFLLPLRYARWKQVHAVSAPAFLLAGLHGIVLAPGGYPLDRFLAAASLLIGCGSLVVRYLMEGGRVRSLPYRVEQVMHPTTAVTELVLSPDRLMVRPKPGQFVFVAFFEGRNFHGCGEFHPFTVVSSDPGSGRFTLLVKALGDCTGHMCDIEPGTRARVEGPYGNFLATIDAARPQLWIAGGIGITPFISAAAAHPPAAEAVDLFYLSGSPEEAVGLGQLQSLAERRHRMQLHCLYGRHDIATVWQEITNHVPDAKARQIFMCGPPALVDGLRTTLLQAGVPQANIHSERFDFR